MRIKSHCLPILLALGLGLASHLPPAHSQQPDDKANAAPAGTPAAASIVGKQKNLVIIEGAPLVLLWARGLTDVEEVEAYAETGLNTLYIRIAQTDEESLAKADELISEGEDSDILSLAGLDARAAQRDENGQLAVAAQSHSPAYQQRVHAFVSAAVSALKSRPGLAGWIIEGLSPELLVYSDADFQAWLESGYQSIDNLNQSWGSDFTDFSQIGQNTPARVDAERPGQLGRAAIDLGLYRYWLYRDLLDLWANEILRADAQHLVILGGQGDFRSLTVPSDLYQGIVAQAAQPKRAASGAFEGIEAIDMARRANTFLAFGFADAQSLSNANLYDWAGESLLHGAAGIGFDGWSKIKSDKGLQDAIGRLRKLAIGSDLFPRTPQAATAFLYEPLAGGSAYGFLPQPASEEPGALFRAFARGTRFGPVDYLTEDMLRNADLSRYGVIFAPVAFALSSDSEQALIAYVNGGGVLVGDWGIGAYASGTLNYLPESLANLFGTGYIFALTRTPLDLAVFSPDPLFPSLPFEAITSGQRVGGAFSGLVGDVKVMGEARRFMTRYAFGTYAPSILINDRGSGHAVFASAPLWENWQRGDDLFEEFHGDLISRRALVAVSGGSGLFTPEDVVLFDDGAVGLFRTEASPFPTQVAAAGEAERLFDVRSGFQVLGADRPAFLFGAAGPNIAVPTSLKVDDVGGPSFFKLKEYGPTAIVLEFHGPGASFSFEDGEMRASGGNLFGLGLFITSQSNGYIISAGSRHKVTFTEADSGREIGSPEVTASSSTLSVAISAKSLLVRIEPAAKSAETEK